jgi:shikimate kinase
MINFREHSEMMEGVNDPSIFKAVFLAGGPGSGKSFVVGKTSLASLGFKIINSDTNYENALTKAGLTMDPEDIFSVQGQAIRDKAKAITGKQLERALIGRLGVVIDGTGKDYTKIKTQVNKLREIGYAVHMIFVNTDLETAQQRNKSRPRVLPADQVEKMWKDVQKNIGKFQGLFRNRMTVVDNSTGANIDTSTLEAYKDIKRWASKPPENSIAQKWIKSQRK